MRVCAGAVIAVSIEQNPLLLMIPATISCSYAFMLPVATPPNAIIFASQQLKVRASIGARLGSREGTLRRLFAFTLSSLSSRHVSLLPNRHCLLQVTDMARAGLIANLIGLVLLSIASYYFIPAVFL
jgi:di/tricarboxylate transporter